MFEHKKYELWHHQDAELKILETFQLIFELLHCICLYSLHVRSKLINLYKRHKNQDLIQLPFHEVQLPFHPDPGYEKFLQEPSMQLNYPNPIPELFDLHPEHRHKVFCCNKPSQVLRKLLPMKDRTLRLLILSR